MTTTHVRDWLKRIGLDQYAGAFIDNDVDFSLLPTLTDDDLRELGLSLGHRRKFLQAIKKQLDNHNFENEDPNKASLEQIYAERRQVTVMFCDLVGSTALSESMDPEEFRDLLRHYQDSCKSIVVRYDGYVARYIGDGILIYFGYPVAHENDAERAIKAGLEIAASISELRGPTQAPELAVRIGIATGIVVVGDLIGEGASQEAAITGDAPNLAARLQSVAKPNNVVIANATHKLAGAMFDCEMLENLSLNGVSGSVTAWLVRTAVLPDSRFDALRGASLTRFVGRSHELNLLKDRWRQAQEGEGQVVLLSGEAGIGKSRILREFRAHISNNGATILRYQCAPHEINSAFYPIVSEIAASCGFNADDDAVTQIETLERHFAGFCEEKPEAASILATLFSLPSHHYPASELSPQRRKQLTIQLLCDWVLANVDQQPVVLFFEDVHWIDPSSLDFLSALIGQMEDQRLFAVITFRPEFEHQWQRFGHVTSHSLNRLRKGDGREIAERVAKGKKLPDTLLDLIVRHSDGVPLFVEELTKAVLETGVLAEEETRYVLNGPLPDLAIPTTLQESLMARLDRLAPVRQVIQAAACIGREFSQDLLAAALSVEEKELDDALEKLIEAELIFQRAGAGGLRFIFKHALVQDTAYASILKSVRRDLHLRLAQSLEKSADHDLLDLARHFFSAERFDKAAHLYLSAGKRSLGNFALLEAIGALELGLNAARRIPTDKERDASELELRVLLGAARMAQFGWPHPSVADALESAFPLALDADDADALGSILWGLWVHYQTRTNFQKAREWLSNLAAVADTNPDTDLPVVHHMSAGCQYFWEAEYDRAIEHTDNLKQLYNQDRHQRIAVMTNHDPLVFSQHWAGSLAEWIRGYPAFALERLEEALDLARRIAHPFNSVFALTAGSTCLVYLNRSDQLFAQCDEAEILAQEEALGPFAELVCVGQWRGGAHTCSGEFESGLRLLSEGNSFWNQSEGRVCDAMFKSWIVNALSGLGRFEEAVALSDQCIAHCRESGDRFMEPECLRLRGELALAAARPRPDLAERFFREAIECARMHGAKSWELRAATSLSAVLRQEGRPQEARACLEPILAGFPGGTETSDYIKAKQGIEALS